MGVLPKKIIVAFRYESSCFTGKLGGIGELLKNGTSKQKFLHGSWSDKTIPMETFDNEFIEGFVLNTSAGGRNGSYSGRHIRESKIRVYDPRGIEFEITIDNLLEILGCCNSTKGKALEGRFCYFWNGSGSVYLLSEHSPTYYEFLKSEQKAKELNFINKANLVNGETYLDSKNKPFLYVGKQDAYLNSAYLTDVNFIKSITSLHDGGVFVSDTGYVTVTLKVVDISEKKLILNEIGKRSNTQLNIKPSVRRFEISLSDYELEDIVSTNNIVDNIPDNISEALLSELNISNARKCYSMTPKDKKLSVIHLVTYVNLTKATIYEVSLTKKGVIKRITKKYPALNLANQLGVDKREIYRWGFLYGVPNIKKLTIK